MEPLGAGRGSEKFPALCARFQAFSKELSGSRLKALRKELEGSKPNWYVVRQVMSNMRKDLNSNPTAEILIVASNSKQPFTKKKNAWKGRDSDSCPAGCQVSL